MKTLTFALTLLVVTLGWSQTLTQRIDMTDGKCPSWGTIYQDQSGFEAWSLNETSDHPLNRIGVVRPVSAHIKAGAYLSCRGDQKWINPRLILSGSVAGGKGFLCTDLYQPIGDRPGMLSLSDAYVVWPIGQKTMIGPDANFWREDGKPCPVHLGVVVKHQLDRSSSLYLRADLAGGNPKTVRIEFSHRF